MGYKERKERDDGTFCQSFSSLLLIIYFQLSEIAGERLFISGVEMPRAAFGNAINPLGHIL